MPSTMARDPLAGPRSAARQRGPAPVVHASAPARIGPSIIRRDVLRVEAARRRVLRDQLRASSQDDFRPDVEGLRAVAVVAVLLFHLRIGAFSGGFVGVDVFFVLSGFLITRLLLRELAATGTISLRSFWARRARRLLPAAAVVVVVTMVAAIAILPPLALRSLSTDVLAAGGFMANVVFAHRLGDYFGAQLAEAQPSPLLHFWSLAVEEQFYLLWPGLLVLATRRPKQYRRLLAVIVGTGIAASLLLSVWLTGARPTWAFYLLPARMGELLLGAALALIGARMGTVGAGLRAALGWFGMVGITVAVLGYDASTPFPGTAALLPALATVLVIAAGGEHAAASGPVRLLGHPAAQWIGRHSYAIYLWHWPALVLAEARFGALALPWRVSVVAGSIGVAAVSVHLVEDPVRHHRWLAGRPGRGLALGGALCTLVLCVGALGRLSAPRLDAGYEATAPVLALDGGSPGATTAVADTIDAATPAVTEPAAPPPGPASPTSTAAASLSGFAAGTRNDLASLVAANGLVLEQGLTVTEVPSNLRPSLGAANADRAAIYGDDCVAIGVEADVTPCRYGAVGAATTVVLYGDSHAAQWFPALVQLADAKGFELLVLTKGGCPTAAVSIPTATLARTCPIWRDSVVELLAEERPEVVIVSAWAGYPNSDDEWRTGLDATMARLAPLTRNLVVLGDNPPADVEPASCLSANVRRVQACVADRHDVVPLSRLDVEREVAAARGARFVDTTDWLCGPERCPVIIGDILLYRDATHLTTVAAEWFQPLLAAALAGIV